MHLPNSLLDLAAIRQRYQHGLLAWLRDPADLGGLRQMRAVLGAVALVQPPTHAPFWRDAERLLLALVEGRLNADATLHKLAGKIDSQLRELAQGQLVPDNGLRVEIQSALKLLEAPAGPGHEAMTQILAQTAAILPFVVQTRQSRFPAELSERWRIASEGLIDAWHLRHREGWAGFRRAIFHLLDTAMPFGDPAFIRLAEALASATDRVDDQHAPANHLVAALAATLDCLAERDFLEHRALHTRLIQFAQRLEAAAEEESRVTLGQVPVSPPEPEVRLPQKPVSPIFSYLENLKQRALDGGLIPADTQQLQPLALNPGQSLAVEQIAVIEAPLDALLPPEPSLAPPTLSSVRPSTPVPAWPLHEVNSGTTEPASVTPTEAAPVPPEAPAQPVQARSFFSTHAQPSGSRSSLSADGQLLARVAGDLQTLADSLHLSGLSDQAARLGALVVQADAHLQHSTLRQQLLEVVQYMQDQVNAVSMGMPPHADPRINALIQDIERQIPPLRQA